MNDQVWKEMSQVIKGLEAKGMEIKECAFGPSRSEFVKGKDFEEFVMKNIETVCKDVNKIMGSTISPTSKTVLNEVYHKFQEAAMMGKAMREEGDKKKNVKRLISYEQSVLAYKCNCGRNHETEEQDHQRQFDMEKLKQWDPSFFYVININRSKSMVYFYLFLAIFGVLMYALMPVWPYKMKVVVWWISYIMIIVIVGIMVVRLIIYLFFYIFGYNIWVFPDLQNEKLGFFASFKRVISCEKRDESWVTILIRVAIALITGYIAIMIYLHPNYIDEAGNILKEALKDFYVFGEDKLVNSWNTTAVSIKRNTPRVEDLIDLV